MSRDLSFRSRPSRRLGFASTSRGGPDRAPADLACHGRTATSRCTPAVNDTRRAYPGVPACRIPREGYRRGRNGDAQDPPDGRFAGAVPPPSLSVVKIFTDPGHVILLAVAVAIALAIYLVRRRRRNVDHHLDDDDQHGAGHDHQHGAGHGPADPERHHL